jgi:hypothetical protein
VVEGIEIQGEKQQQEEEKLDELAMEEQQEGEEEDGINNPGKGAYNHDPSNEDDEDLQPAKRRKLPLGSSNRALTPPCEHSPKLRLRRPDSLTPPSATPLEMNDV